MGRVSSNYLNQTDPMTFKKREDDTHVQVTEEGQGKNEDSILKMREETEARSPFPALSSLQGLLLKWRHLMDSWTSLEFRM